MLGGLELSRAGYVKGQIIVAGRASASAVLATIVEPLTVFESTADLAADAQTLVVRGSNLPERCADQLDLGGLLLGEHVTVSECSRVGFTITLRPAANWGRRSFEEDYTGDSSGEHCACVWQL